MEQTIAAISTGMAPGGIGVVRISGAGARETAARVFRASSGRTLLDVKGYRAVYGAIYTDSGEKIDDAVALVFRAPKSYTGEDVVELSCHGGLYTTRRVLQAVLHMGARLATPGEFTRRAFLNGKLDLTQAESVMQIISAGGEQAARAAVAGSGGALSKKLAGMADQLKTLLAHLAAWADFPEEDVPEVDETHLASVLRAVAAGCEQLLQSFEQGRVFREGVDTVIAGRTNVGKSTLMNLLAGCDKSIVTQHAGTTRDVVEELVLLGDLPLRLADTAGIRKTNDPVEQIGVQRSWERIGQAQLVLAVFDGSAPLGREDREMIGHLPRDRTVAVINKSDLKLRISLGKMRERFPHCIVLSARSGDGLDALRSAVSEIVSTMQYDPMDGALFTERQRQETERALQALRDAAAACTAGLTLDAVTVCIEDALQAFYSLTGQRASEDVIDSVFERFCVGK